MRALASKTASRPSIAIARSSVTTIISMRVKPDSRRPRYAFVMALAAHPDARVPHEPADAGRALTESEPGPGRRGRHGDVDPLELARRAGADRGHGVGIPRDRGRGAVEVLHRVRPRKRVLHHR